MNAAWLVGTLVAALITALAGIVIALFRFTKRSPEQREQDTAAFSAVTAGQDSLNAGLERRVTYLDGQLEKALARIDALEASDEVKDRTIASQASRIEVLERTLRENHIEIPAP